MEKKYYNAPKVKVHQLMVKAAMLAGSNTDTESTEEKGELGEGDLAKSCSFFYDDEDE